MGVFQIGFAFGLFRSLFRVVLNKAIEGDKHF